MFVLFDPSQQDELDVDAFIAAAQARNAATRLVVRRLSRALSTC